MLFISNYFNSETDLHLDQQLKMLCSFNAHVPCNPQGEYAENNFKTILQSLKTTIISESLKDSFNDDEFFYQLPNLSAPKSYKRISLDTRLNLLKKNPLKI